jgi:hypothetical protein
MDVCRTNAGTVTLTSREVGAERHDQVANGPLLSS